MSILGTFLCIGKSMPMRKGTCSKISRIFGLPCKTKTLRKPGRVGAGFKPLADCLTGCMMLLDIMEGLEYSIFACWRWQALRMTVASRVACCTGLMFRQLDDIVGTSQGGSFLCGSCHNCQPLLPLEVSD